jgi:hypothetical protein
MYEILDAEMQRVKAKAPANYKQHVVDTEKRLNILFDHLNNEDLLKPDTIQCRGWQIASKPDSTIRLVPSSRT